MEIFNDGHLLSRILLTLTAIGYGLVTMKADFNRTHATNPLWTPHARFHVVWQVLSYAAIAIIALCLIWLKGPLAKERLWLAGALGVAVYGGFFATVFARRVFGGALFDQNGYQPFRAPIGSGMWDANVVAFSALSAILVIGIIMV